MPIPDDWSLVDSGAPVSCVQRYGPDAAEFQSGGTGGGTVFAHVRASGAFAAPALDSDHAFWIAPDSANVHYLGLMLRNASAAASASGVTAGDVTGAASYFLRVNRFAQIEAMRGGVGLSQTKIYPAGAGVIAPALGTVDGGYYYRARLLTLGGAPTFRVSQSALAAPELRNEAHWTTLAEFADASEDALLEPGYAGLVFLNGGVNQRLWRVRRYMDWRYA